MRGPPRLSRYELQLLVADLLNGPGLAKVLEAICVYAAAAEETFTQADEPTEAERWLVVRAQLAELIDLGEEGS